MRSYQVYRHVLGTSTEEDVLVFEETDETFSCGVYRTKSDAFLVIYSSQTLSQDYRVLSADDPTGEWQVVQPRERDLEYGISHYGDHFYIVTNWEAKNFRLMRTPVGATSKENWEEVIAHRDDVFLEGIEIFKDHLVVEERKEGLTQIRITTWDGSQDEYLEFNDPAYTAGPRSNPDFNTEILRFGYSSMTTPGSTFDHNMRTGERTLLKQQEVIDDNFSPDNYTSERLMVEVRDGVKVPVSMVYRKGTERNGENPFLLYAYGSYGSQHGPLFLQRAPVVVGPRICVCDCPHPGGPGDGPRLVRGRQAARRSKTPSTTSKTWASAMVAMGNTRHPSTSTPWAALRAAC